MKRISLIALLSLTASQAFAITNGGFETGNLSGWSAFNSAGVTNLSADAGIYSAKIDALSGGAINATALEAFAGVTDSSLKNIKSGSNNFFEGSALQQSFYGVAGSTVSFNWRFLTNEMLPSGWDFSFVALNGLVQALGDTNVNAAGFNGGAVAGYSSSTGWHSLTEILTTTGLQTLTFAVLQGGDNSVSSGLLIDNVQGGAAAVPEPATLALLGLGVVAIASRRRFIAPTQSAYSVA